jgi:hypothetical protein
MSCTNCKTREQATAALEGREFDCDIEEILDLIFGDETVTTNADPGDGDDGSGPKGGGGHP